MKANFKVFVSMSLLFLIIFVGCQQTSPATNPTTPSPTEPTEPAEPTEPVDPINPDDPAPPDPTTPPNNEGAPQAPTGFLAVGADQKLELSWNKNSETDISSYIIHWDVTKTDNFANQLLVPGSENTAEITGLENGKTYFLAISAKDTEGLESEKSGGQGEAPVAPDLTAPSILSFSPSGTEVDTQADIIIRFSEAMDIASLDLNITPDRNLDTLSWSADNTTLTLDPGFKRSTIYSFSIEASDLAGNTLVGDKTFLFTIEAAPEPPTVITTSPVNKSKDIDVRSKISITFSKSMNRESVEETLSFDPEIKCEYSWSSEDKLVTCTPSEELKGETEYRIIMIDEFQDTEGNNLEDFEEDLSFITAATPDTTQPRILSFTPESAAIGVKRYQSGSVPTSISFSFSEAMNKADTQAAFRIIQPNSTPGTFSWNAAGTVMSFTPNEAFEYGESIIWTLSSVAKDLAGNSLVPFDASISNYNFRIVRRATVELPAIPIEDGHVAQDSSVVRFSSAIRVGWNKTEDLTYRGFLSFDLTALPDTITNIQSASLYLRQRSNTANAAYSSLFSDAIAGVYFQHVNHGSLSADDFYEDPLDTNCSAITNNFLDEFFCNATNDEVNIISSDAQGQWKNASVLYYLRDDYLNRGDRNNRSQYKLRFLKDRGSDLGNGFTYYTEFVSANSTSPYKPYIEVTYEYP